ncbi:hypothetical protein T01_15784 [Trichinella spiralis]|uniref:Uncharacterized protein n=1 Tax=Trichinella spiralis TaxID=6334 RepID=A0A0V1B9T9_TRISP|nr:hypothetical protein T01_15784 [Trichinella spiralis]
MVSCYDFNTDSEIATAHLSSDYPVASEEMAFNVGTFLDAADIQVPNQYNHYWNLHKTAIHHFVNAQINLHVKSKQKKEVLEMLT